ncbi:MAG: phytanoyl-CoA dioxygenase family protein [Pseudomonadota bacterium]
MLLNEQELKTARQQLLEDGFCIVDGHLPEGTIDMLRSWSDDWLQKVKHSKRWKYQGSDIYVGGIRHQAKHYPNHPKDEVVDMLIEQPKEIMAALGIADLHSGGIFQIISKPAHAPALYWHQDWGRWGDPISMSPWPQQVFLNWYLTDTRPENGCLRAIPGSHLRRLELHSHLIKPHEGGGYDVDEEDEWMFYDHPEAIDVPVKAGQLLIADARLLHSTHPNHTEKRRTVLLGWFYRKSNEVPENWQGEVPPEILARDPEHPFVFEREPGDYLR